MNSSSTSKSSENRGERQIEVLANNESWRTGLATGLSLLGGAALGAGLMYLLDPDEGADRRRTVGNLASGAISASGSALQSGWEKLKDTAGRVYDAASEGAGTFKDKLSQGAEYVTDNRYAKRISKSARRASDEASDRFGYLWRGRQSRGLESGVSQGLAAAACLALGVGAMYFLDPLDGARRRHLFRDKFLSAFGRMAAQLEKQGQNIWNHATGMAHEARSGFSREQVDDRTLAERIRATIGRYVDNAGAIDVQCTQGRAMLRGAVMASQLDRLLKVVRGVRGVSGIDDQLDVRGQPGSVGRGNEFTRSGSPMGTTTSSTQI